MKERLILTVIYKNGNKLRQMVNYLHVEHGRIWYTIDKQTHYSVVEEPVGIPLDNVESLDLEQALCNGWELPDEQ